MILFSKKKREDSHARRNARLFMRRARGIGVIAAFLAALGLAAFSGYKTNSFQTAGNWMIAKTLAVTADAGFKVKDILVTGRSQIPAEELLTRLSIKENMPILGVNITAAQNSLAGIAWIKEVSIARRLPDKILVELQERKPVALWQHQKKISLIDRDGVVLPADSLAAWQQLPLVVGEDAPRQVAALTDLLNAEPTIAQELATAVRIGGRRWDLRLKNGISVKLPEQDAELALRHLAAVEEEKKLLSRDITAIDLRQPDNIVLTPGGANNTQNKS